ncbi:hypothetical protein BDN70DRAFT_397812 [Pholiota conissans]|uniref:Uncharacterized protein n=1 Tax=Pholiota conissans TaxID=109636 RepID=A0A9P5YQL3_9AGAR|nr:hypothetical protein BDN70DRAFT_397812 [Pholiota conissans]
MRRHQIVEHSCFGSFADSGSMYKGEFNAAFEERCWSDKARTCVKFRADLVKPIERFVEMCELDPKVTTAREMDELNPIFECRTCSSVEKGRLTMTWARAIPHPCAQRQKSIKTKTFVLLDEHESSQVRFGMALEENRAIRKACRIMCPNCKYRVSGHDKYLQHMREEHGVLEVPDLLDLDYHYTPSDDTTTPLYRFFPSAR